MAEWLRRGLQILAPRFDSGRGLQLSLASALRAKTHAARERWPNAVQPIAQPYHEPPLDAPRHRNIDGQNGKSQGYHPNAEYGQNAEYAPEDKQSTESNPHEGMAWNGKSAASNIDLFHDWERLSLHPVLYVAIYVKFKGPNVTPTLFFSGKIGSAI